MSENKTPDKQETPRSNDEEDRCRECGLSFVPPQLARQLERELAEMRAALATECGKHLRDLQLAESARGDSWNWRLVTEGGYESYRTYLVTDGFSTVTGFHTPKGWVRHDSIDATWTPTHWQLIPNAPK